jgi:hypothetical protein
VCSLPSAVIADVNRGAHDASSCAPLSLFCESTDQQQLLSRNRNASGHHNHSEPDASAKLVTDKLRPGQS